MNSLYEVKAHIIEQLMVKGTLKHSDLTRSFGGRVAAAVVRDAARELADEGVIAIEHYQPPRGRNGVMYTYTRGQE